MAECLELVTKYFQEPTELKMTEKKNSIRNDSENTENQNAQRPSSAATKTSAQKIQVPSPLSKTPTQQDVLDYIQRVNLYINRLGYHHKGEPGIRVLTHLSFRHHMETARQIIKAGENIKCLHAMLLGIYFTNSTPLVERFPINFKSKLNGKEYRHVVLGIYAYGAYGALGLSRDAGLQDKPPTFLRLSELLKDFASCYTASGHTLLEIKVGGIIPRDTTTQRGIPWRVGVLSMSKFPDLKGFDTEADKLARLVKAQMSQTSIRPALRSASKPPLPPALPSTSGLARQGLRLTVAGSSGKLKAVTSAGIKKKSKSDTKIVLIRHAPTSSKLTSTSSNRRLHKTTSGTKGAKAKKKKVPKYKRFAEP